MTTTLTAAAARTALATAKGQHTLLAAVVQGLESSMGSIRTLAPESVPTATTLVQQLGTRVAALLTVIRTLTVKVTAPAQAPAPVQAPAPAPQATPLAKLLALKPQDLRALAKGLGIDATGSGMEIATAVLAKQQPTLSNLIQAAAQQPNTLSDGTPDVKTLAEQHKPTPVVKQPQPTCNSTTAKGTPCNNKAKAGSDKCAQHQPKPVAQIDAPRPADTVVGDRKPVVENGIIAMQQASKPSTTVIDPKQGLERADSALCSKLFAQLSVEQQRELLGCLDTSVLVRCFGMASKLAA